MTPTLQRLIDALRDELQQHGEVLGLLDATPPGLSHPPDLQHHWETLRTLQARRVTLQQQFAWSCQRPDAWAPDDLLPLLAAEIQPLLRALFEEIHSLRGQLEDQSRLHFPLNVRWSFDPAVHPDTLPQIPNLIVLGAATA